MDVMTSGLFGVHKLVDTDELSGIFNIKPFRGFIFCCFILDFITNASIVIATTASKWVMMSMINNSVDIIYEFMIL